MKKLLVLFMILFAARCYATHLAGAELFYKSLGGNQYLVTLHIFRDCSGSPLADPTINFGSSCGDLFSAFPVQVGVPENVSQLCPQQMGNSTCDGGAFPGMEKYTYTVQVNLQACSSWTMSWTAMARNTTVNAISTGSDAFYVAAFLNNLAAPGNNSAYFTGPPQPYYCVNQPACLNLAAVEPDGNTLSFALVDPMVDQINTLAFNPGYSATQPIPGMVINAATGALSFTPTVQGNFVVVVECTETNAAGVVIGKIRRDFQVVVTNCNNQVVSCEQGSIINVSTGTVPGGQGNTLEVCEGESFCFDVLFVDPDAGDSIRVSSPNLLTALPGASIVMTYTPGMKNSVRGTICWTPPPGSANSNTYFTLVVRDNACPVPAQAFILYYIDVLPPAHAGPDLLICGAQTANIHATGPGTVFAWSDLAGVPVPVNAAFSCNPCSDPVAHPVVTTTYVVTNTGGNNCSSRDTVVVKVVPDFTLSVASSSTITCLHTNELLTSTVSPQAPGFTYTWTPATGLAAPGAGSTGVNHSAGGTYVYTLQAESADGCHKQGAQLTLEVLPFARPDFTVMPSDPMVCAGTAVPLDVLLGNMPSGMFSYSWQPPAGLSDPLIKNPVAVLENDVTYTVVVTPTVSASCANTKTLSLVVSFPVTPTIVPVPDLCGNAPSFSMNVAPAGGTWLGPAVTAQGFFTPATAIDGINNLHYSYQNGPCITTASTSIFVEQFVAAFMANPQITTITNPLVQFTNLTEKLTTNTYQWSFTDPNQSQAVHPSFQFPYEEAVYPVQLIATSARGCIDTTVVPVYINPELVLYMPNAFTPGNADGLNDILYAVLPRIGLKEESFVYQVFDRWGTLLFETRDPGKGWNGARHNSGSLCEQGVYVWRVVFDGRYDGIHYEKTGQVTLLK